MKAAVRYAGNLAGFVAGLYTHDLALTYTYDGAKVSTVTEPDGDVYTFAYSSGKNASDMAMVIDAMDLLYARSLDAFAIVSSDADFTPLVMHLKAKGAQVFGFGAKKTPAPFVNACSRFLYLENLGAASGARYAVKAHGSELEYSLRGNAELAAWGRESLAGAEAGQPPFGDLDLPLPRHGDAGEEVEQGGLAGARRAGEHHPLARGHGQVDAVEHLARRAAVAVRQAAHRDRCGSRGGRRLVLSGVLHGAAHCMLGFRLSSISDRFR